VLAATRADGSPALLKVPVRDEENRHEAAALRAYAGDGAALLYAADPATGALLMERLEPGTPLMDDPDRDLAIDVACGLLRRLRRPVPAGHPFHPVPALVRRWANTLPAGQARHGDPVPAPVMDRVTAALQSLLAPEGPELLVNRDAHLLNVLAAEREPWLLIDPKPLVGEPAFDGGWLLIDVLLAGVTREHARRLAARIGDGLGVDGDRVRAWALVRAAENTFGELDDGCDPSVSLALVDALA
jgi:streptomycin 6-kinase